VMRDPSSMKNRWQAEKSQNTLPKSLTVAWWCLLPGRIIGNVLALLSIQSWAFWFRRVWGGYWKVFVFWVFWLFGVFFFLALMFEGPCAC
jgi:hypothetical protein